MTPAERHEAICGALADTLFYEDGDEYTASDGALLAERLQAHGLYVVEPGEAVMHGTVWRVEQHRIGGWDVPVPDLLRIVGTRSTPGSTPTATPLDELRHALYRYLLDSSRATGEDQETLRRAALASLTELREQSAPYRAVTPAAILSGYMERMSFPPRLMAERCGWPDSPEGEAQIRAVLAGGPIDSDVAGHLATGTYIPDFVWLLLESASSSRHG